MSAAPAEAPAAANSSSNSSSSDAAPAPVVQQQSHVSNRRGDAILEADNETDDGQSSDAPGTGRSRSLPASTGNMRTSASGASLASLPEEQARASKAAAAARAAASAAAAAAPAAASDVVITLDDDDDDSDAAGQGDEAISDGDDGVGSGGEEGEGDEEGEEPFVLQPIVRPDLPDVFVITPVNDGSGEVYFVNYARSQSAWQLPPDVVPVHASAVTSKKA